MKNKDSTPALEISLNVWPSGKDKRKSKIIQHQHKVDHVYMHSRQCNVLQTYCITILLFYFSHNCHDVSHVLDCLALELSAALLIIFILDKKCHF